MRPMDTERGLLRRRFGLPLGRAGGAGPRRGRDRSLATAILRDGAGGSPGGPWRSGPSGSATGSSGAARVRPSAGRPLDPSLARGSRSSRPVAAPRASQEHQRRAQRGEREGGWEAALCQPQRTGCRFRPAAARRRMRTDQERDPRQTPAERPAEDDQRQPAGRRGGGGKPPYLPIGQHAFRHPGRRRRQAEPRQQRENRRSRRDPRRGRGRPSTAPPRSTMPGGQGSGRRPRPVRTLAATVQAVRSNPSAGAPGTGALVVVVPMAVGRRGLQRLRLEDQRHDGQPAGRH